MQYRLYWYLVPLTRSFFQCCESLTPQYLVISSTTELKEMHRPWELGNAFPNTLKMYSSDCLDSVRKFNFSSGFSWELSLSFRCKRALAPKAAWKIRVKLCPPHIQNAVTLQQLAHFKSNQSKVVWLNVTLSQIWTVWIIVTVCTAAVVEQPYSLFPLNTDYTLCKGTLRKGLVYLRKIPFLQQTWPFQGVVSMYYSA